jgi:hypothetical protein
MTGRKKIMNKDLSDYSGALKFAFTQVHGGKASDWTVGAEVTNSEGKAVQEFRNEKAGIMLHVSGQEEGDYGKFNAKRVDDPASKDEMNVSIPKAWKAQL